MRERLARALAEVDAGLGTFYPDSESFLASLDGWSGRARIRAKGQLTIPRMACRIAGIEAGDELECEVEGRTITLRKVTP